MNGCMRLETIVNGVYVYQVSTAGSHFVGFVAEHVANPCVTFILEMMRGHWGHDSWFLGGSILRHIDNIGIWSFELRSEALYGSEDDWCWCCWTKGGVDRWICLWKRQFLGFHGSRFSCKYLNAHTHTHTCTRGPIMHNYNIITSMMSVSNLLWGRVLFFGGSHRNTQTDFVPWHCCQSHQTSSTSPDVSMHLAWYDRHLGITPNMELQHRSNVQQLGFKKATYDDLQQINGHDSGTDSLEVSSICKAYVSGLCKGIFPHKIWPKIWY